MSEALNPDHVMTRFAQENATKLIALLIWKLRRHIPNLQVELSIQDMQECTRALGRGVVAVTGKGDGLILQLVDTETGKALALSADARIDNPAAVAMERMLVLRDQAPALAEKLRTQFRDGTLERDTVQSAIKALLLLSDKNP